MTDKHDFKAALRDTVYRKENLELARKSSCAASHYIDNRMEELTIIAIALRLADRLQSGEVSDDMISATGNGWHYSEVFKAMVQQMIEEVEDE